MHVGWLHTPVLLGVVVRAQGWQVLAQSQVRYLCKGCALDISHVWLFAVPAHKMHLQMPISWSRTTKAST